jgi:hypothetical protein
MKKKVGLVVHVCHPSEEGKLKIGGLWSRLAWANVISYLHSKQSKRAGGVAQVQGQIQTQY